MIFFLFNMNGFLSKIINIIHFIRTNKTDECSLKYYLRHKGDRKFCSEAQTRRQENEFVFVVYVIVIKFLILKAKIFI